MCAERLNLVDHLVGNDRGKQPNHYVQRHVLPVNFLWPWVTAQINLVPHNLDKHQQEPEEVEENEQQKELVVSKAEAVVDEWAVVVEQFGASVAELAVEASF